jgi:hypothetical protein
LFGTYFVARAVHFGYLFPNTFYAKLDYGNWLLVRRGLLYVWDFLVGSLPMVALTLLGSLRLHRAPLWVRASLLVAAVELLGVIYEGGDHFGLFRFLVPVVPFLMLSGLYPAAAVCSSPARPQALRVGAVVVSIVAIAASGWFVGRQAKRDEPQLASQWDSLRFGCRVAREWELAGRWLHQNTRPDATIVTVAIGAIGFFSDRTIIDPHGMVNTSIAHRHQELGHGLSGHEKYDVDGILARRPGYILLVHYLTPEPVPADALGVAAWGEFNQELVRRPGLPHAYRYESVRCGQEYLNVLVRRDLPALSSMTR